jgi:hypothetical protein
MRLQIVKLVAFNSCYHSYSTHGKRSCDKKSWFVAEESGAGHWAWGEPPRRPARAVTADESAVQNTGTPLAQRLQQYGVTLPWLDRAVEPVLLR